MNKLHVATPSAFTQHENIGSNGKARLARRQSKDKKRNRVSKQFDLWFHSGELRPDTREASRAVKAPLPTVSELRACDARTLGVLFRQAVTRGTTDAAVPWRELAQVIAIIMAEKVGG